MNVISGFEWDFDRKGGRRDGVPGSRLLNTVGQGLKETYRDLLEQGVPEHFLVLLERLDQRKRSDMQAGDA
jgi:Anti-sigma factor NepR